MAGKFVLKKNASGQFHFNLQASNLSDDLKAWGLTVVNGVRKVLETSRPIIVSDALSDAQFGSSAT